MKTRVDATLRHEAERFRLRFTCEDCAHFAPEARACGEGYPTEPHRALDLAEREALEFCKSFELA